ncbi:MAG: DUF2442 domain-containing protein [Magnetococcales bacterium]|nr:DUF2442 domain-containing protein [Magnetococcales bacterium]
MILHTASIQPVRAYRLRRAFNSGESGEGDHSEALTGELFASLRDRRIFASAARHPLLRIVVWSHGVDWAPEFLREWRLGQRLPSHPSS